MGIEYLAVIEYAFHWRQRGSDKEINLLSIGMAVATEDSAEEASKTMVTMSGLFE